MKWKRGRAFDIEAVEKHYQSNLIYNFSKLEKHNCRQLVVQVIDDFSNQRRMVAFKYEFRYWVYKYMMEKISQIGIYGVKNKDCT